ncbi:carbamoyltransferase [Myceligenerans pegani]|uniref:Carbamoyltransferase n=1 Tax=Myceligenerans pegani TaxID=2776917 RepID=A0ABR9MWH2_9MICO|nr:carbamoyltransferase N-terminal domain-containing protein [Myceligenerans sp. TRM 65318]MBE1875727.1 hypothetical protein [Myceligenerans sp. TRM 65318]MBE3017998.1 hypothetical protein [Myceligenerans sp. TRM 65318]
MTSPVLGINFGTHDSAAALVLQGRVLAAVEEERLTRDKHTKAFPTEAIKACLDQVGLEPGEIDDVALFVDPRLQAMLAPANLWHAFPDSLGSLRSDVDKYLRRRRLPAQVRERGLLHPDVRITPVAHHRAHAASAYLTSPFDDALVVTLDGRGEYETACIYDGRDGHLRKLHSVIYPHSFGYLYSMLTRYLGFQPQNDEYKVMGLAAYGSTKVVSNISQLATVDGSGRLRLNLSYFDHHRRPSSHRRLFSPALVDLLGPPREPDEEINDRHRDVAHGAQVLLEKLVLRFLRYARKLTPHRRLCLAGGVALNCVLNQRIVESGLFDEVYVQPAAGDPGASVGAALLVADASEREAWRHALHGPELSDNDVERAVQHLPALGYRVTPVADPAERAAELLAAGKVLGWAQGRTEFGPRALGARSILAPAQDGAVVERINALIKRRELFRPLAPAVLAEHGDAYFRLHAAGRYVYPYMLATADVIPAQRGTVSAVVHVDGTARVQTVERAASPMFWDLIEQYRRRAGLPVVLNTSFNEADEPIVNAPADAVRTFVACGLDALVMGKIQVLPPAR